MEDSSTSGTTSAAYVDLTPANDASVYTVCVGN